MCAVALADDLCHRDPRLEQDLSAFLSSFDFQGFSTFCYEIARAFHHFVYHLIVVARVVMEKQKPVDFRVEGERNDT